jgi:RNA polymerase sigma-70 factor (ECF subfamily)
MGEWDMAVPGLPDEALLAGMAHGDDAAVVVFVRRYQRRVYGLARAIVDDPAVAEEVAQEALIRVWRHAPVFDSRRGSVATWVLTITRNLAIDALRLNRATPTDPDDFAGMVSAERSPEDSAIASAGDPELRQALAALPPEQRRALVLAAAYGRTAAEISEAEAIPLGTAKTRIRAGMSKMRAVMAQREAPE